MTKNKPLFDIGVYYISTAINQAVPFLLLPVFTVYLRPDDYGFINNFQALEMIVASLFTGLTITLNKFYYTRNPDFIRMLIGNMYSILSLGILFIFLVSTFLVTVLRINVIPKPYFLAIGLVTFFYMSLEFLKTLFKISKRALAFTLLTFSDVLVNVSLSLFLVIALAWNWQGRVLAIMLSTTLFGIFALLHFVIKEKALFKLNATMVKEILKVSLPLIPLGVSVMVMRKSGVLFIDAFFGKAEAGLYGVAMNLATLILFLSVPIINVWSPFLFEKLASSSTPGTLSSLYHKMILICVIVVSLTVIFSLFSRLVLKVMTAKAFYLSAPYIPWLAFGFCFWAMSILVTPFLIHFNRQKTIGLIAIGVAVLNLLMTYVLLSALGSIGAAVSFFASNLLSATLLYAAFRHHSGQLMFPRLSGLCQEIRSVLK